MAYTTTTWLGLVVYCHLVTHSRKGFEALFHMDQAAKHCEPHLLSLLGVYMLNHPWNHVVAGICGSEAGRVAERAGQEQLSQRRLDGGRSLQS